MDRPLTQPRPCPVSPSPLAPPARICLVTSRNDPASIALADQLRTEGHDVSCIAVADLGVSPVPLGGSQALADSYVVYLWLRQQTFDVVFFTGCGAPGYYSLLARHQGLAFAATRFGLILESATLWQLDQDGGFLDHLDQLECDALERRCVELADGVLIVPPALHEWMAERDWPVPRAFLDQRNLLPEDSQIVPAPRSSPLVSVCLVHHDRPTFLLQALASLEAQDYPHFEIVLVDDGSSTAAARECLTRLEPLFLARGWPLIRQTNRYLGAARNTAARHARGDYFLFMDDDNLAKPGEISTLVRAAVHSGADILTTFMDFFQGETPPAPEHRPLCRWLFAGTDSVAGVARNCYGDANALVRRSVFESLGGFTEDHGITHEDWEFFAKAAQRGHRLEVVPEALFWYRQSPGSMYRTTPAGRNYARSLRPFLEEVPPTYRDLLRLAQGLALSNLRLREQLGLDGKAEQPLRYRIADALHAVWRRLPLLRHAGPVWRAVTKTLRRKRPEGALS